GAREPAPLRPRRHADVRRVRETLVGRNRVSYRVAPAPEATLSRGARRHRDELRRGNAAKRIGMARADTSILTREATTMTLGPRRTSYQHLGLPVLGLPPFPPPLPP